MFVSSGDLGWGRGGLLGEGSSGVGEGGGFGSCGVFLLTSEVLRFLGVRVVITLMVLLTWGVILRV